MIKSKPSQDQKPYCKYPRWSEVDKHWDCCHGGSACGACHAYPQNCKPYAEIGEQNSDYWIARIKDQALMEKQTDWRFCPWCGTQLIINPKYHICGTLEWD